LKQDAQGSFNIANPDYLGMARPLLQHIQAAPDASLRDHAIAANRENPDLQQANVDSSGHNYWVDAQAGFTPQEQTDLVQFLLSLDDDPQVFPAVDR